MATMATIRRSLIPGFRFEPTDVELVHFLRRRVKRDETFSLITDMDVYEKEPWLLKHVTNPRLKDNVWYYFVTRKKLKGVVKGDSKRTSRTVGSGYTWRSNGLSEIKDKDGVKVGVMQSLTFVSKNKKEKKATGWVMHEYLLDKHGFQQLVLCRIRFCPSEKNAQYAPRLESLVNLGAQRQPKQQPEYGLMLVENKEKRQESCSCDQLVGESVAQLKGYYGQGFGHMDHEYRNQMDPSHVPMMNQVMGQQQWNEFYGPYLEKPPQPPMGIQGFVSWGQNNDLSEVPMKTQNGMAQLGGFGSCEAVSGLVAQYQQIMGQDSNYPVNRDIEKHQELGSWDQLMGESIAQNRYYGQGFGDMDHEYWNETNPSHVSMVNQAMGKQQWNEFYGQNLEQPCGQNHQNVEENEDIGDDMAHPQPLMVIQGFVSWRQNNDLSIVPMKTEQQQDNVNENSDSQLQLVDKDNVPLIAKEEDMDIDSNNKAFSTENQDTDLSTKQSLNIDILDGDIDEDFLASMEKDMSSFGNEEWVKALGEETPEEEAELKTCISNCKTDYDLFNYFGLM